MRTDRGRKAETVFHFVYGRNVVEELLKHTPERIVELLVLDRDAKGRLSQIIDRARSKKITIRTVDHRELDSLIGEAVNHQSLVAKVQPREFLSLDSVISSTSDQSNALILVLDGIQDPHNFGAALRVAECFAADAVIWSKNKGAELTATVSKISAGASELVNLCPVSNLHSALERLKQEGFWVVTAIVNSEAVSLFEVKLPEKAVIVLGSEESGVQQLIEKISDFKVYLPMFGKIDSLNVAQTTAVFLSEYRRQRVQS